MARRRSRTVWLGKVSFIDRRPSQLALMHDRFPEALNRALDPDRRVTFYREWRLSQPTWEADESIVYAQLGFRRRTRQEEVDYDDAAHTWVSSDGQARQGNFANFVIDVDSQLIAFEDRGNDLKRSAFLSALGRFLKPAGLEVNLISDAREFDTWVQSMDRVTRFRVSLRHPNPGWSKRAKEVRELAGEIEAERLTIEAESESGLVVKDTLLDGAADTAALANGAYKATGEVNGKKRFFDSARRFVSGLIEVTDSDDSVTIVHKIRSLMLEISPKVPQGDESEHV
jgi:hypothetical protein